MCFHLQSINQELTNHQSVIENVEEKGKTLQSPTVSAKLGTLKEQYKHMCKVVQVIESSNKSFVTTCLYYVICEIVTTSNMLLYLQDRVKQSENYVNTHQKYSDNFKVVHDWLQGVIDKLEVCREPSTDKHSIQSKLDRLAVSFIFGLARWYKFEIY